MEQFNGPRIPNKSGNEITKQYTIHCTHSKEFNLLKTLKLEIWQRQKKIQDTFRKYFEIQVLHNTINSVREHLVA